MRADFQGEGPEIPLEAMPDANLQMAGNAVTFKLPAGDFIPQQYMDLGFTHYQVWAVGAAGGQGGEGTLQTSVDIDHTPPTPVPDDIWPLMLEEARLGSFLEHGVWDFLEWDGWVAYDTGYRTRQEYVSRYNPEHLAFHTIVSNPRLIPMQGPQGGGPGGGGLHTGSGALADLPAVVPVGIGEPGATGALGHSNHWLGSDTVLPGEWSDADGTWRPRLSSGHVGLYTAQEINFDENGNPRSAEAKRYYTIQNLLLPYRETQVTEEAVFYPPAPGGDGGPSFFGDFVQASGGKGGNPGVIFVPDAYHGKMVFDGKGGAGGIGGRLEAGGGATGSQEVGDNGSDGSWDGTVGSGGGGGHSGGSITTNQGGGILYGPNVNSWVATDGGRGALSFVDTAIFGERGLHSNYVGVTLERDPWPTQFWIAVPEALDQYGHPVYPGRYIVWGYDQHEVWVPAPTQFQLVAGGGGSAKPGFHKFGSRAPGYSPKGAVIIRLTKQT